MNKIYIRVLLLKIKFHIHLSHIYVLHLLTTRVVRSVVTDDFIVMIRLSLL